MQKMKPIKMKRICSLFTFLLCFLLAEQDAAKGGGGGGGDDDGKSKTCIIL